MLVVQAYVEIRSANRTTYKAFELVLECLYPRCSALHKLNRAEFVKNYTLVGV